MAYRLIARTPSKRKWKLKRRKRELANAFSRDERGPIGKLDSGTISSSCSLKRLVASAR